MKYTDGGHDYELRYLGNDNKTRSAVRNLLHDEYDPVLRKVKYIDYKHKLKLDRQKEAVRAQVAADKQAAQRRAQRSKSFSSARQTTGKVLGILPLVIILSVISVIGANFTPLTETFTVGDQSFTRYRASGEDANIIGSAVWDFGEDLLLSLANVGLSFRSLFISENGSLNTQIIDMVAAFITRTGQVLAGVIDTVQSAIDVDPMPEDMNGDGKVNFWDTVLRGLKGAFMPWAL